MGALAQRTLPSGFLAGLTAGSIGASGPAVIAWAHSKTEWELPVRRAATLAVFASINPMRLPFYIAFGLMTTADIWGVAIGSIPSSSWVASWDTSWQLPSPGSAVKSLSN